MTLAELMRNPTGDCITSHETIRAVLTALADMPGKDLFVNVSPEFEPFDDLAGAVDLPVEQNPCVADVFAEIHAVTTYALYHSHISDTYYYANSMKPLSLLSQLPNLYLPPLRQAKGN